MSQRRTGIAGAGRLAQALGRVLHRRGQPVAAIASRQPRHAAEAADFIGPGVEAVAYEQLPSRADRILIAVPDDAIAEVAALLASAGMRQGEALHTSGVYDVDTLSPLQQGGVSCATLHPLQTFADPLQGVDVLPGAWFAISGAGPALAWARQIVALLEGQLLELGENGKPLYHAAAVMGSNYVVALVDAALTLMEEAGIERGRGGEALRPLLQASLDNALGLGPVRALTGPIQRGDAQTVGAHLRSMAGREGLQPVSLLYRSAGLYTLRIAVDGGLSREAAGKLERCLKAGTE